ncbi:MAG: hypothetical protein ORN57_04920 [Alphaproteobacteria bacterium]|nr:hypothetical protein [Alphaproteobacteria bacterium]
MFSFPIFLDLSRGTPLVIGQSNLAVAKVRTLLLRATRVDVMAESLPKGLEPFARQGVVCLVAPPPKRAPLTAWKNLLRGRPLVVIDPREVAVVKKLYPLCRDLGLPINVADQVDNSSFSFGALVDRRPLTVAIATDGIVPVLATAIREKVEQQLEPDVGLLVDVARQCRARVNGLLPMGLKRRIFWQDFLQGPIASLVRAGRGEAVAAAVEELLLQLLSGDHRKLHQHQRLVLIGLPDNNEMKGHGYGQDSLNEQLSLAMVRAIKNADVILHDGDDKALADVLALARREVLLQTASIATMPWPKIKTWLAEGQAVVAVVRGVAQYQRLYGLADEEAIHARGLRALYHHDDGAVDEKKSGKNNGGDVAFHSLATLGLNPCQDIQQDLYQRQGKEDVLSATTKPYRKNSNDKNKQQRVVK